MTDMHPDQPNEHAMGLVVPFVACTSQGGPFDDESFVNGFDCGVLHTEMRILHEVGGTPRARWVKPGTIEQVDLLAMHNGFVVKRGETDDASECTWVEFVPVDPHAVIADD